MPSVSKLILHLAIDEGEDLTRDATAFLTLLIKEHKNIQKWRVCHCCIIRKGLLAVCSCSFRVSSSLYWRIKPSRTAQLLQEIVLWISVEILYFEF